MALGQKIITGLLCAAMAIWLAAAILGELGLCGLDYVNFLAASQVPGDFQVRSRLLMEAMDFVGTCCPGDAALAWAEGLRIRSAALQYAVMSAPLREEYARQLNETAPNWVTGVSSPFVSGYRITGTEAAGKTLQRITLRFSFATSTGPAGEAAAVLDIAQEGNFRRIVHIGAEEALFPYMGFMPF